MAQPKRSAGWVSEANKKPQKERRHFLKAAIIVLLRASHHPVNGNLSILATPGAQDARLYKLSSPVSYLLPFLVQLGVLPKNFFVNANRGPEFCWTWSEKNRDKKIGTVTNGTKPTELF